MATHLNPNQVQLADIYGGRERVKDLSGWEGDTTKNATDKNQALVRMITRQTSIRSILLVVCKGSNPMTKPYLPIMLTFKRIRL